MEYILHCVSSNSLLVYLFYIIKHYIALSWNIFFIVSVLAHYWYLLYIIKHYIALSWNIVFIVSVSTHYEIGTTELSSSVIIFLNGCCSMSEQYTLVYITFQVEKVILLESIKYSDSCYPTT